MWHVLKSTPKSLVTLIIESDAISCSLFTLHQKKIIQQALHEISLEYSEIEKGIIFNITRIKAELSRFLKKNNATDCYVALALPNNALQEKIVTTSSHDFSSAQLAEHIPHNHVSNVHTLATTPELHKVYLFSMARELLLHYQLLALTTPFNCCLISSSLRALLELSNLENAEFSTIEEYRSHSKNALQQHAFESTSLHNTIPCNEQETIATHIGLFLLGKRLLYENK